MAVKRFEREQIYSKIVDRLVGRDRVSFLLNLHCYGVAAIDLIEELMRRNSTIITCTERRKKQNETNFCHKLNSKKGKTKNDN